MQSVQKNVAIPATLRVSARQRDDNMSTYFDADIAKTVVGDGIINIFQQTPRLLLNADSGMEDLMMTLREARIVLTTEADGTLSGASEPMGPQHVFEGPAVTVTRLDTTDTDEQATMEFRVPQDSLLPQLDMVDVVYARAYLMATVYKHQFDSTPAMDDASNNAVVATNTGAEVYDMNTDLFLVAGDGGSPITVGGGVTEKSEVVAEADVAGSLMGKYFALNSPTTDYYVWMREMVPAVPEITEVDCEADVASSLNNKYWEFTTVENMYYVWYNVAGAGVDPMVVGRMAIEVAVNADATATDVAVATAAAIDMMTGVGAANVGGTVTITNVTGGDVADAMDGDTMWTTAWTVTQQGADMAYTADPMIAAKTGIPVTIMQDDNADTIAGAIHLALNAMPDFSTTVATATVSINNTGAGDVDDIADGDTGWMGFSVTEQGSAAMGDALFIHRTDIVQDPMTSEDVVIGAMEFRVTNADDIDDDLMHGTLTSQCEIVFRLVV